MFYFSFSLICHTFNLKMKDNLERYEYFDIKTEQKRIWERLNLENKYYHRFPTICFL